MAKIFLTALATIISFSFFTTTQSFAQERSVLTAEIEAWLSSPHADRSSEAFRHWDEDGAVPENCATCHSGPGVLDFLGADGSAAGVVDHPAVTGAPIDCVSCHNEAAMSLQSVTFPSGEEITGLGTSMICSVCHQGRASGDSVNAAVAELDDDTVSADLGFINVHYRAAAASMMGGLARGGYQYDDKTYVERFAHVKDLDTCAGCHDPHSLEVVVEDCVACHKDITDLAAIRMSPADADGDGDTTEGVAGEVATMLANLDAAIRSYAADVSGAPIAYASTAYPYYFADTDGDGTAQPGEAIYPNRYQSWTPRLLKAAYNYQFVIKDPGAYAHNPRYVLQLLYDSIEDLASQTGQDISGYIRP
ncbi:MAG: polyheme membrane-associated cytochrome C [Paracoccaceae bacterium]